MTTTTAISAPTSAPASARRDTTTTETGPSFDAVLERHSAPEIPRSPHRATEPPERRTPEPHSRETSSRRETERASTETRAPAAERSDADDPVTVDEHPDDTADESAETADAPSGDGRPASQSAPTDGTARVAEQAVAAVAANPAAPHGTAFATADPDAAGVPATPAQPATPTTGAPAVPASPAMPHGDTNLDASATVETASIDTGIGDTGIIDAGTPDVTSTGDLTADAPTGDADAHTAPIGVTTETTDGELDLELAGDATTAVVSEPIGEGDPSGEPPTNTAGIDTTTDSPATDATTDTTTAADAEPTVDADPAAAADAADPATEVAADVDVAPADTRAPEPPTQGDRLGATPGPTRTIVANRAGDAASAPAAGREHVPADGGERSLLARAELQRATARRLDVGIATSDLGRIRVTAVEGADGIQLQLSSDRPDGRARLDHHLHDLRQELDDRGVGVGSLEVGAGGADHRSSETDEASPGEPALRPVAGPTETTTPVVPIRTSSHVDGLDLRL